MEQVDSWVTKSQEEDQAPMPKVRTEYVPLHDSEERMAEQRGSGGREQKVKIPKWELREQKGEDEVTALPARGSRPRLVWHEVEEEEEILYSKIQTVKRIQLKRRRRRLLGLRPNIC